MVTRRSLIENLNAHDNFLFAGDANPERAAPVDVEQPSAGEQRVRPAWKPKHTAAEHQRVGAGVEHATSLQPTLATPVEEKLNM